MDREEPSSLSFLLFVRSFEVGRKARGGGEGRLSYLSCKEREKEREKIEKMN
jgi:hypothetical protein